jgi:excisionase family DNA binding protein
LTTRRRPLNKDEIARAFAGAAAESYPVILSPAQLADLLGRSIKTVYEWLSKGRLDGAYRKRGKHVLIWRDRALELIFNGPSWSHDHDQS